MKRKGLLISGVFLSITYSLLLVYTIFMTAAAAIFQLLAGISETVKSMFYNILKPILILGESKMFIFLGIAFIACVFLTIVSKKLIKYATISNEKFARNKKFIIFICMCVGFCTAGFAYLLINTIINQNFGINTLSILSITELLIHILSLTLIIVCLCKEPEYIYTSSPQIAGFVGGMIDGVDATTKSLPKNSLPKIYIDGLEEQTQTTEEQTTQQETIKENKNIESSKYGNQLIEAIMRLDNLRKQGKISTVEYTKLRGRLVRKFTK